MPAASETPVSRLERKLPVRFSHAGGARPLDGYTIKRGIGAGGFGEVYYATSDGGKDVALKLIRRNLDIELRGVRQCLNLKHPNLLALYDVRQDEQGNSWVIMEYVSGECLEDVIAAHPQGLPVDEALVWFGGVAAAVAHLHEHGIVHRDLKPGNIFRDQGFVKLGDYGLSKFISVSRRSGQTESIGTVHYMAPEIAKGRYGKEIDIYALGVLLFELLTGHVPFEGESVGEVLMKHLTAQPELGRLVEPYRSAVAACLAKDPAERPRSVAELLASLHAQPGGRTASSKLQTSKPQTSTSGSFSAKTSPSIEPPADARPASGAGVFDIQSWPPLRAWQSLGLPTKVLVSLVVVYALLQTSSLFARGMLLSCAAIGAYWYFRSAEKQKLAANSGGSAARAGSAAPAARQAGGASVVEVPQPPEDPLPLAWPPEVAARSAIVGKSHRERLAELLGSLLFATVIAAALVVVVAAVRGTPLSAQQVAWQWLVGTLGSWLVLVPAKCWETGCWKAHCGDDGRRRFVMLILGLCLGLLAWAVAGYLWVDLPYDGPIVHNVTGAVGVAAFEANGQPRLLAYLAYFGLLMLVPRWWLQADPARRRRVNLWSTTFCVCYALVLNQFCAFPQPWAMFVAGTMSLAVQLASGWNYSTSAGGSARHAID